LTENDPLLTGETDITGEDKFAVREKIVVKLATRRAECDLATPDLESCQHRSENPVN
jgi:hypothetical protein